jgi:ABC-type transport system involved in cytochrome bd biosynthesis fused ATPase/permease subunit
MLAGPSEAIHTTTRPPINQSNLSQHQMMNAVEKHIAIRGSFLGRWAPAGFYALNVALWFLTGIVFEAWDLLYLVFVTLPALALYVRQTR